MVAGLSLEGLLKRDGVIVIVSLFVLWALTWLYLVTGAGLGMTGWEMTRLALLPQLDNPVPALSHANWMALLTTWSASYWALVAAMWWSMMIAMMLPSAAPTILLYARVH